jgi:hypothetical protein
MSVNLNTVLTGIVTALTLAVLSNGWDVNKSLIKVQANQDAMAKQLTDMVPRAEFETRFKSIEAQVLEVKVRQSAFELELMKLREKR